MKKLLSLIFLFVLSFPALAGTIILTTSNTNTNFENRNLYGEMMVHFTPNSDLPPVICSSDMGLSCENKMISIPNVNNFEIQWIGVNSLDLQNFKQIDLNDCKFTLGADEIKQVNILVSGDINKSTGLDNRTAICQHD